MWNLRYIALLILRFFSLLRKELAPDSGKEITTTRKLHNAAVFIYIIFRCLIHDFFPNSCKEISLVIIAIIGIVLIIGNLFYLFFDSELRRIKTVELITSAGNSGNYYQILLLLFFSDLDVLNPFGTLFYITVCFLLLLFCFGISLKDILKEKSLLTTIVIGHSIFGYFLYNWGKAEYIQEYGNEIIGSFWEKPDYETKYLVKLSQDEGDQIYKLPAKLHVFSQTFQEEFDEGNQSWTEKYIMLKYVYFNNGGFLKFDDCNLNEGDKVHCIDQNDNGWYIELTEEKLE